MFDSLRKLRLLLYKNLLVCKSHWKLGLFVEILIPMIVVMTGWLLRDLTSRPPIPINHDTYYTSYSMSDIIKDSSSPTIYFTPNNEFVKNFMLKVHKCISFSEVTFNETTLKGYSTEEELIINYKEDEYDSYYSKRVAVVFDKNVDESTKRLNYKIRSKNLLQNGLYNDMNADLYYRYKYSYITIQMCLDKNFIETKSPNSLLNPEQIFFQQMPYPPHIQPNFGDAIFRQLMSILIIIALMIPLFIETGKASNERFLGVNVLMSMNGVSNSLNLISWLISSLIFMSVCCVLPIILMLKLTPGDGLAFLYFGNTFIIWLVFTIHIVHLLTFGIHISAYFPRPLFVIFGLVILNVGSMALQLYGLNEENYKIAPYLGIIFPNLLLFRAIEEFNYYETISEGTQWNNLFAVGNADYKIGGSVGMVLVLSLIGSIIHYMMSLYVYAINPGKYGARKHPLFFLKFKSKSNASDNIENLDYNDLSGKPFETVRGGTYVPGIQIRNLKKSYNISIFNNMKVHALKGISIDFYKGQITSLLGHNGAGKTTMMSILTGMINPTDGLVLINSKNIKDHSNEIMNEMGLCTQENMVFPNLTIRQQLKFFAMLKGKGKSKAEIEKNIQFYLQNLKLHEKRNSLPAQLSGGQKRRLCLAMALVGDPNILILDEPTSGLDPESRRVIWDILLKMRGRKTILISTHDMEEADVLGDRIAIMHTGELRSYGTSLFLKRLIGEGNVEVTLSVEPRCDIERVRFELNCEGKIISIDGSKTVISIPNSPDLPDSLDRVEMKKKELGISGLSVSLISLEQIFLKITQEHDEPALHKPHAAVHEKLTGSSLFLQYVRALLYKKLRYTIRNISTIILMLFLIFAVLLYISFTLKEISTVDSNQKITQIKLSMYREPETYYKSYDESFSKKYRLVTENFGGKANEIQNPYSLSDGLLKVGKKDRVFYDKHAIAAVEFNRTDGNNPIVNALFSGKAIFSFPISVNLLSNTILRNVLDDTYGISLSIQALPEISYYDNTQIAAYSTAVIFTFIFFPIMALFVIHSKRESSTGIKQLQRMSGVSSFTYWGTMFIFDFIVYLFIIVIFMIGLYCTDVILKLQMYHVNEVLLSLLLFVLFAINILPLIYTFSFVNMTSNNAVRLLIYVPIGLVSIELIMVSVYAALNLIYKSVRIIRSIQKPIFLLTPYISYFHSQMSFYYVSQINARCRRMPNTFYDSKCNDGYARDECCQMSCYNGDCKNYKKYFANFDEDLSLEESLIYLCLTPILYFGILFVLENQLIQKLMVKMKKYEVPDYAVDEQVKQEKFSIAQKISSLNGHNTSNGYDNLTYGDSQNDMVTVQDYNNSSKQLFIVYELRKRYGNLIAVKDVSFGVNKRECFGLLGVNGAGKSTTFRMMTGGEVPDNGIMYIGDKDFKNNRKTFLSQLGYCSQNDAIIKSLNAYDHLRLFARLRGIPEDYVESEVQTWIQRLNLKACAAQPSGTYSGGNKRRLNIAIALIGNPNLVLMDEPTTGVDPGARRSLWNVIQACQTMGQAVILTSHSMEECEALCNRLAIMVGGRLVCIGPSQELKQRFGAGYDIQIKMNPEKSAQQINGIKNDIEKALNCELVDEHSSYLMYHVSPNETTWRQMYNAMHVLKSRYESIEDYSILSSTLEQLFLLFARAANNDPKTRTE